MNGMEELFTDESVSLHHYRELASQPLGEAREYQQALFSLSDEYHKLMKESYRLICRSDRAERELNRLNDALQKLACQLEYEATHDALTQVFNRRAIISCIEKTLQHQDAALILLDIDRFKTINDCYGHAVGDAVLCDITQRFAVSVPDVGVTGRVGGEEFTIFLPCYTIEQAHRVAHKISEALNASPLPAVPDQLVTASIGVSFAIKGSTFHDLYNRADAAMYAAKHRGRNQICCG
ncbi:MAG: Diguanylate cyclase DgcM [Candidatus Erwinia impunctatus]|nr:Diguanylate cyclase DgcM [Culicoides impunctatus]